MRKLFIFTVMFLFTFTAIAQKDVLKKQKSINTNVQNVLNKEFIFVAEGSKDIPVGVPIGLTNYDLQTNNAVARRMIAHGDGTYSAVWLQDHSDAPGGSTRGTGYNHFNGTDWQFTDLAGSNATIDGSQRTGWPTISIDGAGNEIVFNHINAAGGAFGWIQSVGASNSDWTQQNAVIDEPVTWPRSAQSGQNIVIMGCGETDLDFNIHNPVVLRSTDGGALFTDITAGIDFSSQVGFGGDGYAIAARDDVFAFVVFSGMNDVAMWKSIDAGLTWEETTIIDLPIVYNTGGGILYDQNNDRIADVVCATDGTGDIIIDSEGKVHVVFSRMNHVDDDPVTPNSSYFPYTDWVLYWNEGMGAGHYTEEAFLSGFSEDFPYHIDSLHMALSIDTIGWFPDLNGNGEMDLVEVGVDESPFGRYYLSLSTFSSIGIDASDNLYVAYSTVMEGGDFLKNDATPNAQQYRHVWLTKYNGEAWGEPTLISAVDGNNAENVFPSMATNVDDNVHLWIQWDNEPGLHIRGDEDPTVTDNYIVYKSIPVTEFPDATVQTYDVDITIIDSGLKAPVNGADVTFAYGTLNCGTGNAVTFTNAYLGTYDIIVDAPGYSEKIVSVTITGDHAEEVDLIGLVGTESLLEKQVKIFPNPASDKVSITNLFNSSIKIYNIIGAEVLSINNANDIRNIDISSFTKGTYFIKVSDSRGSYTQKLIVE